MAFNKETKAKVSFYMWLLEVLIVLGSISYLIWICLTPKDPLYTISNVYFPPFIIGRNSTLFHHHNKVSPNASIILLLEISNPNQGFGIYWDDIYIALHYNDSIIGNNSLKGFYQGYGENITWKVQVSPGQKFSFWRGKIGMTTNFIVSLKTSLKFKYKIFRTETKLHQIDMEAYVPIKPPNIHK